MYVVSRLAITRNNDSPGGNARRYAGVHKRGNDDDLVIRGQRSFHAETCALSSFTASRTWIEKLECWIEHVQLPGCAVVDAYPDDPRRSSPQHL